MGGTASSTSGAGAAAPLRVVHALPKVAEELYLSVKRHCGVSSDRAVSLVEFGACYVQRGGGWDRRDRKPQRILDVSRVVEEGDYLRVYTMPKEYDERGIDWSEAILHEDETFLLVNKPPGIPCHPTNDNFYQNVLERMRSLRPDSNLWLPQRLDTGTSGLLLLAKTADFVRSFQDLHARGEINKRYRALCVVKEGSEPLAPGFVSHYLLKGKSLPREFRASIPLAMDKDQWQECKLEIIEAKRLKPNQQAVRGALKEQKFRYLDEGFDNIYFQEVTIRLITGRTHQIRGQLAAVGCPIVGDYMYFEADLRAEDPARTLDLSKFDHNAPFCLQSYFIEFPYPLNDEGSSPSNSFTFSLQQSWWHASHSKPNGV